MDSAVGSALRRSPSLISALAILALALIPMSAMAQSSAQGTVSGVVTDTSSAPIAGALISLTGPQKTSTTSGTDGTFSLTVAAGTYTITVKKSGFEAQTQGSVLVVAGQTKEVAPLFRAAEDSFLSGNPAC